MRIAFGSDPNATAFKVELIEVARALGHEVEDLGSSDPIYARIAVAVAERVAAGAADRGVVVCGTGIGVSIAANKVPGARCALVSDIYQAQRAQLSNDANLIAMGAQTTGLEVAKRLLAEYLANTFDPSSPSAVKVAAILAYEKGGEGDFAAD